MANYQLIIQTLLENPNISGFIGEYERAQQRIARGELSSGRTAQGPTGASSLAAEARTAAVQARAGAIGQGPLGANTISQSQLRQLQQAIYKQYEASITGINQQFGTSFKAAVPQSLTAEAKRLSGIGIGPNPAYAGAGAESLTRGGAFKATQERNWLDMAAADQEYILARGELIAALNRLRVAEQAVAEQLETDETLQTRVQTKASRSLRERGARADIGRGDGETDAQYNQRLRDAERRSRQAQREADKASAFQDASPSQRALNVAHGGRNLATNESGLGAFFGGRLLNTAAYGASAAVVYTLVQHLHEAVTESLALQRVTIDLNNEMKSLNDQDATAGYRQSLLGISRDTGALGSQVIEVGIQMRGAFGDTATAVDRTREAVRASQVSGLNLVEVVNSLTAASKTYGTSIDAITDKAVGMRDRFGVPIAESIKSFGDFAPVAQEVGLNLEQVAAILGTIQQRSGRGFSAITDALSRSLPALQQHAGDILSFASQTPALKPDLPKLQDEFGSGQSGKVLITLAEAWDKLTGAQKNYLVATLGGRKEAQYLITLFEGNRDLLKALADGNNDAGKAAALQAAEQKGLAYQIGRVRQEWNQIVDALARLGVFQGLALLLATIGGGLGVIGSIVRLFADWNDKLGGIPGKLIGIAFAIGAISKAIQAAAAIKGAMAVITGLGAASEVGGIAEGAGQAGFIAQVVGGARGGAASRAPASYDGTLGKVGNLLGIAQLARLGGANLPGLGSLPSVGLGRAGGFFGSTLGAGGLLGAGATLGLGVAAVGIWKHNIDAFHAIQKNDQEVRKVRYDAANKFTDIGIDFALSDKNPVNLGSGLRTQVQNVQRDRVRSQFQSAVDLKLFNDQDPAVKKIINDLKGSGGKSRTAGQDARNLILSLSKDQQDKVKQAADEAAATADALKTGGETQVQNAQQLQQSYSAGLITLGTYIDGLKAQAAVLEGPAKTDQKVREQWLQMLAQIHQSEDQLVQEQMQLAASYLTLMAGPDLAQPQQIALALRIAASNVAKTQAAGTPYFSSPEGRTRTVQTPQEAAAAATALEQQNAAESQRRAYERQLRDAGIAAHYAGAADPTSRIRATLDQARAAAQDEVDRGGAQDAAWWQAYAQWKDAEEQLQQESNQEAEADAQLLQARLSRDPVGAARASLDDANRQLANAITQKMGPTAISQAQTAVVNAQHALQDALTAGYDAMFDLAATIAEAHGDTVEAARQRALKAAADLFVAGRAGTKGAPLDQLEGQLAQANAAVTDADLAERRRKIDYQLQMGQITEGQAASLARTLQLIPGLNQKQIDDINLYIKGLTDAAGRDLQFNLPSVISVGSLVYESRRLAGQGGALGLGSTPTSYQDNRQVQIIVQGGDPTATAQAIYDKLAEPSRFGTYPGIYGGTS